MADVAVGTPVGPALPSVLVSNTLDPTHLPIQNIFLECLPRVPGTKLLFQSSASHKSLNIPQILEHSTGPPLGLRLLEMRGPVPLAPISYLCSGSPRCKASFYMTWLPLVLPFQFSSVAQSCPTLCDPMNRSTPGFPVYHQLPEFTQTHVHQVSDAIQLSYPLLSPSPPALNLSQHQGLFQ